MSSGSPSGTGATTTLTDGIVCISGSGATGLDLGASTTATTTAEGALPGPNTAPPQTGTGSVGSAGEITAGGAPKTSTGATSSAPTGSTCPVGTGPVTASTGAQASGTGTLTVSDPIYLLGIPDSFPAALPTAADLPINGQVKKGKQYLVKVNSGVTPSDLLQSDRPFDYARMTLANSALKTPARILAFTPAYLFNGKYEATFTTFTVIRFTQTGTTVLKLRSTGISSKSLTIVD